MTIAGVDRRFAPIANLCPACAPAFRDVRTWMAKASPASRAQVRFNLIKRCVLEHTSFHAPAYSSRCELVYDSVNEDGQIVAMRFRALFQGRRTWVGKQPLPATTSETK
jgi:hypothetical protein